MSTGDQDHRYVIPCRLQPAVKAQAILRLAVEMLIEQQQVDTPALQPLPSLSAIGGPLDSITRTFQAPPLQPSCTCIVFQNQDGCPHGSNPEGALRAWAGGDGSLTISKNIPNRWMASTNFS